MCPVIQQSISRVFGVEKPSVHLIGMMYGESKVIRFNIYANYLEDNAVVTNKLIRNSYLKRCSTWNTHHNAWSAWVRLAKIFLICNWWCFIWPRKIKSRYRGPHNQIIGQDLYSLTSKSSHSIWRNEDKCLTSTKVSRLHPKYILFITRG